MFHAYLCHAVLSVPCSYVITCWEWACRFALLFVVISCVYVTFTYGVPGRICYLIVSNLDPCLIRYFKYLNIFLSPEGCTDIFSGVPDRFWGHLALSIWIAMFNNMFSAH